MQYVNTMAMNSAKVFPAFVEQAGNHAIMHMTYDQAQAIRQAISPFAGLDESSLFQQRDAIAGGLDQCIDARQRGILRQFVSDDQCVALICKGLPVDDDLPPTPYSGYGQQGGTGMAAALNIGLYALMGLHPVTYAGENDYRLLRHVVPTRHAQKDKSSHGSRRRFGVHVDNPDLPLGEEPLDGRSACPEYLSLFGLRCDTRVKTDILPLDPILDRCNMATLDELMAPQFTLRRPDSFGPDKPSTPHLPLIVERDGVYLCRYDQENTLPETALAASAMMLFQHEIDRSRERISLLLLAGDFVIFKNQRVLHARDGFMPRFDGTDRWLLRLFGLSAASRCLPLDGFPPFVVQA